jgi:hypothetical protein
MSTSTFDQIAQIIKGALLEQDSATYHGISGDTNEKALEATRKIVSIVDAEQKDQKRREMMNPTRGIVITGDQIPAVPFLGAADSRGQY